MKYRSSSILGKIHQLIWELWSFSTYFFLENWFSVIFFSPALKKWGYTGFGLSVIPLSRILLRNSVRFFYVTVFSGTIIARILKLGIHMDNELLYCGIENRTPCSYSSLFCPFFCLYMLNLCHSFLRNCAS